MRRRLLSALARAAGAIVLVLGASVVTASHGPLLDDIEAVRLDGHPAARLVFSVPIRTVRHFPAERGEVLNVHLEATYVHGPETAHEEYRHAPHASGLPEFSVTLNNRPGCHTGSNPICLVIQFRKPARYILSPGTDGRSLLLAFPQEDGPAEPGAKPPGAN